MFFLAPIALGTIIETIVVTAVTTTVATVVAKAASDAYDKIAENDNESVQRH